MNNEEFTRAILAMTDTLYRVAATQLRQRADREDAVQECLRKAWEKRHRLREERYLQTWVVRILINECRMLCRRSARMVPMEEMRAAASQVGTVVEELVRSVCFFADGFEYCGGNAVGAVVLSGVCFDNDTFVHEDTVGFVANFRMVWMKL